MIDLFRAKNSSHRKRKKIVFHIAQIKEGNNVLHLLLEGSLDKAHVVALQAVLDEATEIGVTGFVLHCKELRYTDDEGVRFLREMKHAGAKLVDLPLQVRWKLTLIEPHINRAV